MKDAHQRVLGCSYQCATLKLLVLPSVRFMGTVRQFPFITEWEYITQTPRTAICAFHGYCQAVTTEWDYSTQTPRATICAFHRDCQAVSIHHRVGLQYSKSTCNHLCISRGLLYSTLSFCSDFVFHECSYHGTHAQEIRRCCSLSSSCYSCNEICGQEIRRCCSLSSTGNFINVANLTIFLIV